MGLLRLLEAFDDRELFAASDLRNLLGRDPGYLAPELPKGASLIQTAGSARRDLGVTAASHAIAVITLKDGHRIALVIFLTGSTADGAEREAIIAAVGRAVLKTFKSA